MENSDSGIIAFESLVNTEGFQTVELRLRCE